MTTDEKYMTRCLQLAQMGAGNVAPNPMVGAVLVHGERIIGEGYHRQYGQAHAEVNCINSIAPEDMPLLESAVLYVSLEPCAHYGKTPPCAGLIIEKKVPRVIIGCRDPFKDVNGKGIEKLISAGTDVAVGILEDACTRLNKRFFTFHASHRPYIILKWAQTANGKIAAAASERLLITNEYTNRLVHKWRSEEASILVGTTTALLDNPSLTNRLWSGRSPVRMVVDMGLSLPHTLQLFDGTAPLIVFNEHRHAMDGFTSHADNQAGQNSFCCQITNDVNIVDQIIHACYQHNIQSILVEGGAKLLQSFIDTGCWDEARIITNETMYIENGLPAPSSDSFTFNRSEHIMQDRIDYLFNNRA